tara:strand:- start:190 stop:1899 length:1710 start_codon:yes stop_codon:yes gene_type:complete
MSWFQVLKDEDTPEPRREEIPEFKEKVLPTVRWNKSRRAKILNAAMSDDNLKEFLADPEIAKLVENKTQSFIQDIEFVKRLIQDDTITNRKGNTFKSLKEMLGARTADMSKRLDSIGKAKKTSQTRFRASTVDTFKQMIDSKKLKELLELLQDIDNKNRFKTFITKDKTYRKKLKEASSGTDEEEGVNVLLHDGAKTFDSYEYTSTISPSVVKQYLKHVLNLRMSNSTKNKYIDLQSSRGGKKQLMNFIFHSTRGLHPAIEFILDNKSFNTSAMVKGGSVRSSNIDSYLMDRLKTGRESRVKIPEKLKQAFDLEPTGEDAAEATKILDRAKKQSDSKFIEALKELYPEEMKEYAEGMLAAQRGDSDEVEEGSTFKDLLEAIDDDNLGEVNEAMGTSLSRGEFNEQKGTLREMVTRLVDGKGTDKDKRKFPNAVADTAGEHPFSGSNFTRTTLMGTNIGTKATPENIVTALSMVSDIVNGGFTDMEIEDYFEDIEELEGSDKLKRMDEFLDEIRSDYEKTRTSFIERIADNMKLVLKEGMKEKLTFDRGDTRMGYLEPYLYIKKILRIRD